MDKVLKLYKLIDGVEQPFPSSDEQIITSDFTYTAQRMGGAPIITCAVRHKDSLDGQWSDSIYVYFNEERFYLKQTPTSTIANTDVRYKYDLEFVSERIILDSVYFMDVVNDPNYKGISNSSTFMFSGNIHEFATRMNYSLQYAKLQTVVDGKRVGYEVIVDSGVESETKNMSFEDQYFSSVLQEVYNTYELPYYFKGKEIHIGESDADSKLDTVLKYGDSEGLLSITKQNANHKIVNRITGTGSTENIPYYYPNKTPLGEVSAHAVNTNKLLKNEDFVIVNPSKLSRVGLKDADNDGNIVTLKKYVPNSLVGENTSGNKINRFEYLYSGTLQPWFGASTTEYAIASSTINSVFPYSTEIKGNKKERSYRYKYHIRIKGSVNLDQSGRIILKWDNNPNYPTISEQIRDKGDFAWGVFDNLEAYEIADNEERKVDVNMVGTYPSIYLYTTFVGSKNDNNGRDFEIHLKFDFMKSEKGSVVETQDISITSFTAIELGVEKIDGNGYYWSSARASYADITEFGVDLSSEAKKVMLSDPDSLLGEGFYIEQDAWIAPQDHLMPPKYRLTCGKERFYNAINDTYFIYGNGVSVGVYEFPNPYTDGKPQEHIQSFEDIKPTIEGMLNGHGEAINQFLAFAYDEGDNDSMDEEGNLLHPYFFAQLPVFDRGAEFNLFDQAIEQGEMQIHMKSGNCAACTFQIAVDEESQKNLVQVDSNGNLLRDEKGNVVIGVTPQERQNDTVNYPVWIALKKDLDTFPSTMPNMGDNNKPRPNDGHNNGDSFVILNILLPESYITNAEERLEAELIKYMFENNAEKFNFSVNFSRIYLAENTNILPKITENSSIIVEYNNTTYPLHVSSYTYKMSSGSILPEISVELTDTLSVRYSSIQQALSRAKSDILDTMNSVDYVRQGIPYFLRKDINDTATGRISFANGIESKKDASFGNFRENTRGAGIFQDESGNWHIESDFVRVRKKLSASTVEIEESYHIGGTQLLTAAGAKIDYVVEREDSNGQKYYRCYFLKTDESGRAIQNKWKVGDQAYCEYFNLEGNGAQSAFYWRKVINTNMSTQAVNETIEINGTILSTSQYHFVDLSYKECAQGSDTPKPLDTIVQLGYQGADAPSRQSAIMLAGAGEGSPYIQLFEGINSFHLPEPETQLKPGDNILSGKTKFKTHDDSEKTLGDLGEETKKGLEEIKNLEYGVNIIRNSGFVGNYDTKELELGDILSGTEDNDSELFSPSLESWSTRYAKTQKSEDSASGTIVVVNKDGYLEQTLYYAVEEGANYILSWKGKGGGLSYEVGGVQGYVNMNNAFASYHEKFTAIQSGSILRIYLYSKGELCELSLLRGTIPTNTWEASPFDNRQEFAKYESLSYLQNLLKADTIIDGGMVSTGVVNTGLINMGHYDENGKMMQVTAGMSGTWNNDDSVAFFGGGDLAKAIYTVQKYKENPNYEPTTEELASMAKAVITHGGRAILQDIILRGYVYAEGGVFRGKVYAEGGEFNGTVNAKDGVFNGMLQGASEYGSVQMGISNDTEESKRTILSITSPLLYSGGKPVVEQGYATTFSWTQDEFGGAGYTTLNMDAFSTSAKFAAWYAEWSDNSEAYNGDKTFIRAGTVRVSSEQTQESISMSNVSLRVNDAKVELYTPTIQVDINKLPTKDKKDTLVVGQLYRDGDTLKIKTS